MTIKFQCECGQSCSAKESLIGKAMACRQCERRFVVLDNRDKVETFESWDTMEESRKPPNPDGDKCSECGALMPYKAVLCGQCGYHQTLKTKITQQPKPAPTFNQESSEEWAAFNDNFPDPESGSPFGGIGILVALVIVVALAVAGVVLPGAGAFVNHVVTNYWHIGLLIGFVAFLFIASLLGGGRGGGGGGSGSCGGGDAGCGSGCGGGGGGCGGGDGG